MNCPLCDTPVDGENFCPNCGTQVVPEVPTVVTEPDLIPETRHPGIFYENLISSHEIYEEEHKPKKAPRYDRQEKLLMTGAVLLLVLFIGMIGLVSRQYDPDAIALKGDYGISMDNRTFSIYYYAAYQEFVSAYSDSLPFDPKTSLKKQYYNLNAGYTWEDYFISEAYSSAALTERVVAAANRAGYTLDDDAQRELDATWETLCRNAQMNNMTPDRYLQTMYGPSMTAEAYFGYLRDTTLAQAYTESLYYSPSFTEEEIQAYYEENASDYSDLSISQVPNVDIRHILILPADDSEEADAAAKNTAENLLTQCQSESQEQLESCFLKLATEYSQDSGSNENGGLLENLSPGQIGGEFDDWCFDPSRHQIGDTALVSSQYGYHVVYFAGYRENYGWMDRVLADMRSDALGAALLELTQTLDCRLTRFAASEY